MKKSKAKDPDQQAVYYAEKVTFEQTLFDEPMHSDDFMKLADRLFTHDWWERHNVPVPVIEPTTGRDSSSYAWLHNTRPEKDPVIRIAPMHINPWILAHEASHVAQYHFYKLSHYGVTESHGREFRATYLSVAEIVMGVEATERLRTAFARNVKVRPEHAIGRPGSIMTVPRPRPGHDPAGLGIYPMWRLEQHQAELDKLKQRPVVTTVPRLNGAIAL